MAQKQNRIFNVIPIDKIKQLAKNSTVIKKVEIPEEEEDMNICCRICNKCFANETAIRNHVSMQHIDAFISGNPGTWMEKKPIKKEPIRNKTEELISSTVPSNLMTLASEDVDYIIIKAEDVPPPLRKRKREKVDTGEKSEKAAAAKKEKEKEATPIVGPFECLQPSAVVADGTCHQIFFSCCEYSIHFRDEHTRRRKGLRCQVCEKPLAGGDDQAPFACEVCGAGFQFNKELSNHMATDHVKLKPFECSVCHKRFTQQGGVQQHMRMHTGDRPFPCTFCPKAFTQKSGLDQHLRIHTKVKPYRCVICSKCFCQSVHLRQHMRTHTNVSPFQCGICNKRFKQSSHLNYHLKNHNQRDMTEEQKTVYRKLMTLMNNENKERVTLVGGDSAASAQEALEGEVQQIEMEIEEGEIQETEIEEVEAEEYETVESEVLFDEHETYLAEQSIKVEAQPEYVLSDLHDI